MIPHPTSVEQIRRALRASQAGRTDPSAGRQYPPDAPRGEMRWRPEEHPDPHWLDELAAREAART